MLLDLCLLSCDLNSIYYEFFPLVKKYWKEKVGIECILILVGRELPHCLLQEKESIIMFPPIQGIPTGFQAQCIRLLYPCLLEKYQGIIISDMDIIPLNSDFFTKTIRNIEPNTFVIYRDVISEHNQYPMCYCASSSTTWKNIFKIKIMNDLVETLVQWYTKDDYKISCPYSQMWSQDQLQLYKYILEYEKKQSTNKVIKFTDSETNFRRLDRSDIYKLQKQQVKKDINDGIYSDFHLPRPYREHKLLIDDLLLD